MTATNAALNDPHTADDAKTAAPSKAKSDTKDFYVLDTTAIAGKGERVHQMMVDGLLKNFTFQPGIPTLLPIEVAIKFLKHDAFRLTDKDGTLQAYNRRPKQPDELGAGERFSVPDHQTVANYTELTNAALQQRVLELPGGEGLPDLKNRQMLIDFIIKTTVERRKANAEKKPDIGADEFIPPPEL